MQQEANIQLHFDVLSCRALLCCEGRDYVLPDTYPNREAAEAAAQKFARETLGIGAQDDHQPSDVAIWLR